MTSLHVHDTQTNVCSFEPTAMHGPKELRPLRRQVASCPFQLMS